MVEFADNGRSTVEFRLDVRIYEDFSPTYWPDERGEKRTNSHELASFFNYVSTVKLSTVEETNLNWNMKIS